ncbi:MAG TPA: tail fiber domain-containing protein [Armatimonadota bacterium]|jgi:hypothetical protein
MALASDARFKNNIHTIANGLESVLSLRGVTFDWNNVAFPEKGFAKGSQIGFVAQEVEKVLPGVVENGPDGYKSVAYQNIVPVLVEAIKAQQTRIDRLEQEIRELQTRK